MLFKIICIKKIIDAFNEKIFYFQIGEGDTKRDVYRT